MTVTNYKEEQIDLIDIRIEVHLSKQLGFLPGAASYMAIGETLHGESVYLNSFFSLDEAVAYVRPICIALDAAYESEVCV